MPDIRLSRMRAAMARAQLPAFLVTEPINIGYLSGFTGSTAALIITADDALMVTDGRYTIQAQRECPGFQIRQTEMTQGLMDRVAAEVKALGRAPLGVEGDTVTVNGFQSLATKLEGIEPRPTEDVVEI